MSVPKIDKILPGSTPPRQFNSSDTQGSLNIALFFGKEIYLVKDNGVSGLLSRGEVSGPSQSNSAATNQ